MSQKEDAAGGPANADAPFGAAPKVAVIGAGVAGMACARELRAAGARVEIFEKSRGVGGRCATRRPFGRDHPFGLDHGAPFAEAPDTDEAAALAQRGAIWSAPEAPANAVVGAPGMRDLAAAIGLDPQGDAPPLRTEVEIAEIARGAEDWLLVDVESHYFGPFAAVAVAVPAPQASRLLGEACPDVDTAQMSPCWTLLAALDSRVETPIDLIAPISGPLELIIRNSAKPGRASAPETAAFDGWVAHSRAEWAAARLEADKEEIAETLWTAFQAALGVDLERPRYLAAHRWRYAVTETPAGKAFWLSEDGELGCCGDWRLGPTVGDAHRSGRMLGRAMARALARRSPGMVS